MNGPHDMGGMHGFGPVVREQNEPVFHGDWEKQVYGIMQAARERRIFSVDEMRHAIERMPPVEYLASSYYERWLAAAERLLAEKGVVSPAELEDRVASLTANPDAPSPHHEDPRWVERMRARTTERPPYERPGPAPRFAVGDAVRARNVHPAGHTRLPRYARGKRGVIHQYSGCFIFPDTYAHGLGEQPQPLYSVRFCAREVWGDSAEPNQSLYLDLWESYLEPDGTSAS
ncbi:MAG: nitrile hydratase subunit beta [Chloroflexi bacterium]|nr:nitrile hydratase subunit beta [Chloroflexota bacterium]